MPNGQDGRQETSEEVRRCMLAMSPFGSSWNAHLVGDSSRDASQGPGRMKGSPLDEREIGVSELWSAPLARGP